LNEEDNKYDLLLYFSIFLNCFATDFVQNHLLSFDPKKIKGIGEIPERRLKPIKNIINKFVKNPEQIHVKDKNLKLKTTEHFYALALYFNLNFQKDKINEMFENEIICEHLYKKILSYPEFFKDLIIPKNEVIKLIRKAEKYKQILTLLFFIGTDCYTFLDVVRDTKDFIYHFQEEEMKKNNNLDDVLIDIEKYVEPKKEDNLLEINSVMNALKSFTNLINENMKLIKYSSLIIEKYVEFSDEINIDNLIQLKGITDSIKEIDKKFVCNCNLDEKIHKTLIKLVKTGKIKNNEILGFMRNDVYFLDKNISKKQSHLLEVFDGFDLSLIENKRDFLKKWNIIDFYSIFDSHLEEFLKRISLLVTKMKDFGYLFNFYKTGEKPKKEAIKALQTRFIELLPTYNIKECPNFTEDVVELIYLSDKNKIDIKKFISDNIEKKFDVKTVNDIYINLTEKYKDLSKECNKIIVKYFTEVQENSDPITLAFLIDKCNNIRDNILSNINKYALKEDDIFSLNETKNYKFFRELVNRKIIEKIQNIKQKYIIDTMLVISGLQENIKKNEIPFNLLFPYFKEGRQMEEILKKKISIIFLNDEEASTNYFDSLKSKVLIIIKIKDDLTIICRYFMDFYPNDHLEDIKKINEIIISLDNNSLNYFEINYKKDYDKYIKFLNEAKKGSEKKNSLFYYQILNNSRKSYKTDDTKCIEETEKQFNELKNLFEKDGIDKIDENLLILCTSSFTEDKKQIFSELEKLMSMFKISKNRNEVDDINNDIMILLKREYIFKATSSIIFFIEQSGVQQSNYTGIIKNAMTSFKEKSKVSSLKKKLEFLKNIGIDFLNGENNYITILMKLNGREETIKFLFNITIQECRNLQEILSESDNNFISINDLLDMEKCVEYFMNLGKLEDLKLKNDDEIIKLFKETFSKYEYEKTLIYFTNFINNFSEIKSLQTFMDKSTFLKNIICNIFNGTSFILSNTKENSFQCNYNEKNKSGKKSETKEDIISYRERAQLSKRITPIYKLFIENITEILNISNIMNDIYRKGYPRTITIKIIFESNNEKENKDEHKDDEDNINIKKKYIIDDKEIDNIELRKKLENILLTLKDKQIEGYKTKSLIRFIYGHQYNLLYNHLKKKKNKNIIHLLKYITNDLYKNDVLDFKIEEKEGDIFGNCINNLDSYLNELLKKNNLTLNQIYEKSIIKTEYKFKGVFTYLCEKVEKDLFQIFKYLTGNNPIAQNILICSKDTTNEEITSFLYRSIKCEFNSCFIIGGLESLENEQKECIIELLNNNLFQKEEEKINSCLIMLFMNKSLDIYKILSKKKYIDILKIIKSDFKNEKFEGTNIEIIKSDKSGVGKTTQIKKNIEDKKKKWIYFPIGGVFNQEEIIDRLIFLKIDNNCVLHLDLNDTDKIDSMMEFLFSILITKFYGHNEDIYYLSRDISIIVEIPNTFIDFFEKFSILSLFKIKEMKISNLAPLIVPNELDSNVQVVSNYLKALKENKINKFDLIFPNITPKDFENRCITIKKKNKKKKFSTSIKAKLLSQNECQNLIFESIKEEISEPTYYQIKSFINALAIQLKNLNRNFFLNAHQLIISNCSDNCLVRTFIVQSFIKLTKHFTDGAFTSLLKNQKIEHQILFGQYDEEKDNNNAINNLANDKHEVVSFDKIDPSLVFFHEGGGELFSIITNKSPKDKEYINLLSLKNSQCPKGQEIFKELPDYRKFTQIQFLEEIRNILDIKTPVKKVEGSNTKSLEEIAGNYVFTADNFVKMVLILLRIRSNIPVIMMGETGCGKTFLIRKLSEMKNEGSPDQMKILNLHAGINDKDIIDFITEKVLPASISLMMKENMRREEYKSNDFIFEEKKIWVFFDEINTCKSMGLISELMCKHTYQGNPIPDNIVFIAACNPYRHREKKDISDEKIGLNINLAHKELNYLNEKEKKNIKKIKSSGLVYSVNPLPHSLLNFVFDFGNLTPEDEKDYIRCMIKEVINKIYYKDETPKKEEDEDEKLKKLKDFAKDMIATSQNSIREFYDKSAVSLREIRRFNIFYEFFYNYLIKRKDNTQSSKEFKENNFYSNIDDYLIQIYSINLSIFICYYLRISDKEKRKKLNERLNILFQNFNETFKDKDFLDIPLKEEQYILDNIQIDKGIAKNKALLENVFSLFVAINNKIPIFIVGKPGCSKSLSVQLILKSMQGSASNKPLFKDLPKVMLFAYQGSIASTSKGLKNIFDKARGIYHQLKSENKKNNISLIFFDEMGLAEHSPNNPLKVIHSELEYDQNEGENKIAFIGISNWTLDAAKMNRGISISIPEPDEEDNQLTALTIGESYNNNLEKDYKNIYEKLGSTYYAYKNYLRNKHNLDGKEDFHGNRDFYHLVKIVSKHIIEHKKDKTLDENTLLECAINSIERNFSGLKFEAEKKTSTEIFKECFYKFYPQYQISKEYNVLARIKENINDLESRYLLIISKSYLSTFLLSSILKSEDKKEYRFYIGSKLKNDLNSEQYAIKVLNKIQLYMEKENILILKNLETVYPSMYDLFNQNFTVVGNKNYARLAVGSTTNNFALINNNFKCIINVDSDKIDKEEPPFLNRFEKHILSLDNLLSQELIEKSKIIKSILDELVIYDNKEFNGIEYDLKSLLINCSLDEIKALIYQANKEGKSKDELIDYILSYISLTLPQDILAVLRINGFMQKYQQYFNKIIEYYGKGEHSNISNFLKKMKARKNVIYTFSNNLDKLIIKDVNNDLYGPISKEYVYQINISSIKSENELERKLVNFYKEKYKICIIKYMPNEVNLMEYVKFFIEEKEKDFEVNGESKKVFIFIAYISRILKDELINKNSLSQKKQNAINKKLLTETLSNLSGFYQIFIDDLNGEENNNFNELIKVIKPIEMFNKILNIDDEFCNNILKCASYMKYNISDSYKELNKNNYIQKLLEYFSKHKRLRNLINETIINRTQKNEDLFVQIFKEKISLDNFIGLSKIIKNYFSNFYISKLLLIFYKAENDQIFSTILSNENSNELWADKEDSKNANIIEKIVISYFNSLSFDDGKIKLVKEEGTNKVDIIFGLNTPGIKTSFDRILKSVKENIVKKYRKNEDMLRMYLEDEEIKETKENYFKILKDLDMSLINLINREDNLINIINNSQIKNDELYNLIIDDYYTLFLNKTLKKTNNKKNKKRNKKGNNFDFENINIDNNKKFLKLMTNLRNEIITSNFKEYSKENGIISKLAKEINWLESYTNEITIIQQIFTKLSMKIIEFYEQIKEIINKKEIEYEISKRNPEYTSIVNKVFFLSLDSILRIITTKNEIYDIPNEDFFELINVDKEILQNSLQLENNLNIRSKEVFSLQQILKLVDSFYSNKLNSKNNFEQIFLYFRKQIVYNNKQLQRKLCDNFTEFYGFLTEKLTKLNNNKFNFYKVLSFIFLNEYIKITYDPFRELLIEKILENNDFIKNSSQIFKIILENIIDPFPSSMISNFDFLKEEKSELIKKINNTKNEFLDEVIMNIIEGKISIYFEYIPNLDSKTTEELYKKYYKDNKNGIKNETGIVFDNSLKIFKQTINFLDSISNQASIDEDKENIHLCKLYSIVYVKMYLSKTIYFIKEKYELMGGDIKKIIKVIQEIKNKEFAKVIKIYVFKLFYSFMNNNFEELKNFNFKDKGIEFYNDFPSLYKEKDEILLNYFFLPLNEEEEFNKYKNLLNSFEKTRKNKFNEAIKDMLNLIKDNGLDIFLIISINKILSNLGLKNYISDKDEYQNFSSFAKSLFANYEIDEDLKNLLLLLFDNSEFLEKFKTKLVKENELIDQQIFEMILYGYRYCVNTLDENKNEVLLYKSLFSKNNNIIKESFFPGIDDSDDYHLITFGNIVNHLNNFPEDYGCYVCSCGFYYSLDPCGFPTEGNTFNCSICGEKCGWGKKKVPALGPENHGMVIRPGHYRIFKNKGHKEREMDKYDESDANIPFKYLDQYKNEVIEPILNKANFGFNQISMDYFKSQDKDVRKLSIIGYRLLNFISYSHLFFAYCLGYISEENMKQYLIKDMDIIQIIKSDWNLLKESLQKKNVGSIQIFMNMIFRKLSNLIKDCKMLKNLKQREIFEKEVENLIEECIKNYPDFSIKYNDENKKQLELNNQDIKTIIAQLIPVTEDIYPENEYPMLKYFNLTKYKTKEDLINRMNNSQNYPLLNQILLDKPEMQKMKYIPIFNEFTNLMVENYSFKISREYAKNNNLENEDIYKNDKEFQKKVSSFIKAWNEIKCEAIKYQCREEMPIKELKPSNKLIDFLIDNGDLGGGMYLAAACQNFISWQNSFLQPIIDANTSNGILNCYVDNMKRKIHLHKAKNDNILLINDRFSKSKYLNENDIIYSFSERNIFNNDGKINYYDYNSFVYDYEAIEDELGKVILPGVCLFEGEKELNFVTFWFEGFRGGRSQILIDLNSIYPQKILEEEDKKSIVKYIERMNKEKVNGYDFKDFFGSIQLFIFYLTQKGDIEDNVTVDNVIKNAPTYLKVSDDFKNFFEKEGKNLIIEKIMNLFFFIEHLCFEYSIKTLQKEYKKEIPKDLQNKITGKLLNKEKLNEAYSIKDLGAAVRRFISRYLAGTMQELEIKEERKLNEELSREDLWDESISENYDLLEINTKLLGEFNLTVSQAYEFYKLIGKEDEDLLKEYAIAKNENDENDDGVLEEAAV